MIGRGLASLGAMAFGAFLVALGYPVGGSIFAICCLLLIW